MLIDKCSAEERRRIENAIWSTQQILNQLYNKYGLNISVACYSDSKEVDENYSCVYIHDTPNHKILNSNYGIKGMLDREWNSTLKEGEDADE